MRDLCARLFSFAVFALLLGYALRFMCTGLL